MILYEVLNGVITAHSVKKKTNTGWTTHFGGRITNRESAVIHPNYALDNVVQRTESGAEQQYRAMQTALRQSIEEAK